MRDKQLDAYRALTMMYIVCIIHIFYWLEVGDDPLKSLILVEMPVIFFISGASLSFKTKKQTFFSTLINRIKRVVLPYYIYAFTMLLFLCILSILTNFEQFDVTSYGYRDILRIFFGNVQNIPQLPFTSHLWFILPYMILSCLFPIQACIMQKIKPYLYIGINIIAFIIVQLVTSDQLIRHILCYNIFMLAGYCYYKKRGVKWITTLLCIALLAIITLHFAAKIPFGPMQSHKFPADTFFLCYTTLALCILSLIFSYINIPNSHIISIWNERGYTIYLYQSVVYTMAFLVKKGVAQFTDNTIIIGSTLVLFIFVASTLLSYITYPVERWIISRFFTRQ